MTKKERQEIEAIFNAKIQNLVNCAGHVALENVYEDDEESKKFNNEELERLFWDITRLEDLKKEILNVGKKA